MVTCYGHVYAIDVPCVLTMDQVPSTPAFKKLYAGIMKNV